MIFIQLDIPQSNCDIDDELKAIYHRKDNICICIFKIKDDRNKFVYDTAEMLKSKLENYYEKNFA